MKEKSLFVESERTYEDHKASSSLQLSIPYNSYQWLLQISSVLKQTQTLDWRTASSLVLPICQFRAPLWGFPKISCWIKYLFFIENFSKIIEQHQIQELSCIMSNGWPKHVIAHQAILRKHDPIRNNCEMWHMKSSKGNRQCLLSCDKATEKSIISRHTSIKNSSSPSLCPLFHLFVWSSGGSHGSVSL